MDKEVTKLLKSAELAKYTFRLRLLDKIILPRLRTVPFRGGFGKALFEIACPYRRCTQDSCAARFRCVYSYIFDTPVPPDAETLSLNSHVTHPFIIEPPFNVTGVYECEDMLEMNLILIGDAIRYLPYCILAFERLGNMGIGKERGRYVIEGVFTTKDEDSTLVFSEKDKRIINGENKMPFAGIMNGRKQESERWNKEKSIKVKFSTPGRFEYNGELISKGLEFHILLRSILRRLSTLVYFHCGGLRLPFDFKQLIEDAGKIKIIEEHLNWEDYERFSSRKRKRMRLGGLSGTIQYHGELMDFVPFLLLAEYIHVGKSVSFGFGKIEIS